jgi:hypothetical protein
MPLFSNNERALLINAIGSRNSERYYGPESPVSEFLKIVKHRTKVNNAGPLQKGL